MHAYKLAGAEKDKKEYGLCEQEVSQIHVVNSLSPKHTISHITELS